MKGLVSTAFQYLAFLGYRCVVGVASSLSFRACGSIGRFVGRLICLLATPYRRLVRNNLRIAFGAEKDESEIRVLTRRHFETLGRNTLLSFKFSSMDPDEVEKRVTYEGREHLEAAIAPGRGIINTIAHLGPWELFSQLRSIVGEAAPSTMYRPLTNRFINAHIVAQRGRLGTKLFDRSTGVYGPLKHLRAGGALGILIDQHTGDHGIWCPFFDRLSSTTNLPALLSLRTGAAIISIAILPDGDDRWRVIFRPPHFPPDRLKDLAGAAADLTFALNQELESMIRVAPEEWFWVHNRWKTPQPKFLLNDTKRGLHLASSVKTESLKPFRILLRSPNPLGDACMAMPAVRTIKAGRPDVHLTVLCRENLAPVWNACSEVDAVLTIPRETSPRAAGKLIREQASFDVAILGPNSLSSALEAWWGKVPRIVGFRGHWRRKLLHQIVPPLPVGPPRHHAHSYLAIAKNAGANISAESAAINKPQSHPEKYGEGTAKALRIGICPGAEYGAAKRWPEDQFALVANRVRESLDCQIFLFGSPNERPIGESLAGLIHGDCENRIGETSLCDLIEELKTCQVVLTNDTGTMHLAAMLEIPTVAIFGSTEPLWTRPLGSGHHVIRHHVECSPCFLRECPIDFRCMKEINPQDAIDAVLEVLGQKP